MKELKDINYNDFWNSFILDGNLDALSNIYLHYYDLLYDYGRRHTLDLLLIEDTIQNVFLNLIRFRRNIGSVQNLSGYLVCSFRRQLYLDLKKQKKIIMTERLPEAHFDYFTNPEQDNSDSENLDQLHQSIKECVGDLTVKQQEILFLRFEREISYEEIAKTLDISVDSCYKSVHRTIKIIRSALTKTMDKGRCTPFIFSKVINRSHQIKV